MSRAARIVAATLAVLALVVIAPASASAVEPAASVSPMVDPPDFTPSGGKWRAAMVNLTSSMLGRLTPNKFRAEQIGNAHRYDHSWEQWSKQLGIDGVRTNEAGQIVGVQRSTTGTGTYVDVAIAGLEQSFNSRAATGGTGGKPFRLAIASPKSWLKGAGTAAVGFMAYEFAAYLGASGTNLVGGLIGWDSQGIVCSTYGSDIPGSMMRWASGQDCSAWDALEANYVRNSDSPVVIGDLVVGGATIVRYIGSTERMDSGGVWRNFCYKKQGNVPAGHRMEVRHGSGAWLNSGTDIGTTVGNNCTPLVGADRLIYGPILSLNNGGTPNNSNRVVNPGDIRMVRIADGVVVGTMPSHDTDPNRTLKCRVSFTDGSSATGTSQSFKESSGKVAAPVCPPTPAGKVPSRVTITQESDDPNTPTSTIYDQATDDDFKDFIADFPECATGACALDLLRKDTMLSCFGFTDGCPGWWEKPNRSDLYECRYGTHTVALEECAIYSGVFQPGRIETGSPWSDPNTGTWSGGQTTPAQGQAAMNVTVQDPELARSCDMSGATLNPVDWVLRGGQCLAQWTFVPRPTVAAVAFAGVQTVWAGKPPAVIAEAVRDTQISGSVTGCSVSTTWRGVTAPLLNACSGPMATVAAFTRLAGLAVMAVLVFAKVRRQIAAMVNYNVGQD